ncbi:MAG: hypothetical protein Kow00109_08630 [Acidobacteriota bacterium]
MGNPRVREALRALAEKTAGLLSRSWAGLGLAMVLAGYAVLHWAVLEDLEVFGYDFALRLRGQEPGDPRIVIVAVDDASLDAVGPWPWPPATISELLHHIYAGRPAVVGLDLLLSHPLEAYAALEAPVPTVLAVALAPGTDTRGPSMEWIGPVQASEFRPTLTAGHIHAAKDADGVCRELPLSIHYGGRMVWAFALEAVRLYWGLEAAGLSAAGEHIRLGNRLAIPRSTPIDRVIDAHGALPRIEGDLLLVNYRGAPPSFPWISAAAVLSRPLEFRSRFEGKIVLVGATAYSLGDHLATPFSGATESPGVEIHAHAVDTLLNERFLYVFAEPWKTLVLVVILGVWLILFRRRPELHAVPWYLGLLALTIGVPLGLYLLARVYLPVISLTIALFVAVVTGQAVRYAQLNRLLRRRFDRLQKTLIEAHPSSGEMLPAETRNGSLEWKLQVLGEATEAALRLAHERAELTAFVSHELKTPLTAIRGFAELLEAEDLLSPEDRREAARTIREEVDRLHQMILNYLDVARLEQGLRRVRRVPTRLPDLLARAAATAEGTGTKRIHLEGDAVGDLLIFTDPDLLYQVVLNLLSNALKYSPADRPVYLRTRKTGDTDVIIEVQDLGPGIPGNELDRIFDKFYRGSAERLPSTPGSGLGLAFVRQAVTVLGGRVMVESTPGEGATFRVILRNEANRPSQ